MFYIMHLPHYHCPLTIWTKEEHLTQSEPFGMPVAYYKVCFKSSTQKEGSKLDSD